MRRSSGSHCQKYLKTLASVDSVTVHQIALGSKSGQFDMQVPNRSDSVSLLPLARASRDVFGLKHDKTVAVKVERLDDYVSAHELPLPDLMKLDVQGFECEVLKGGEQTLGHAKAVITEVSFQEFYQGQCRFDQLVSFLAQYNLFIRAFGVGTPVGRPLDQCDVLFLRP
jgi:FkbM family methyltransferase